MGVDVYRTRTVPSREEPDAWLSTEAGYRQLFVRDKDCIDSDDQQRLASAAQFMLDAIPLMGKTVAWIGGGLCNGVRLFQAAGATQTVYEIEPVCQRFCPQGVTFVLGDWEQTLSGTFDLIIYDLGGEVPYERLAPHLKRGGKVLP